MKGMQTAVRGFVLLLTCAQALASADPTFIAADIGNREITLPGPPGYVEITIHRERVRRLMEAGLPPENRHVATFAPPSGAKSVDVGGSLHQWAIVQVVRSIEYKAIDAQQFQGLRTSARSGWVEALKRVEKRLGRLSDETSERIAEELDVEVTLGADKAAPIGLFLDRSNAIGMAMLMRSETKTSEETRQGVTLWTLTFLHVKDRVICLYLYHDQVRPNEVDLLKKASVAWADAVQAAN
jgi:hypothetical protein